MISRLTASVSTLLDEPVPECQTILGPAASRDANWKKGRHTKLTQIITSGSIQMLRFYRPDDLPAANLQH